MEEHNTNNYDFLLDIKNYLPVEKLDEEILEDIVSTLENIHRKATAAEAMVFVSDQSCLDHCGEACEAIAHLFVMSRLPDDWRERLNLKNKEKNDTVNDIWKSEEYIDSFIGKKDVWKEDEKGGHKETVKSIDDLKMYIELFHLKGEYNCEKHNVKDKYYYPVIEDGDLKRIKGELYMKRKILSKKEQKEVLSTENLLRRCRQIYAYLCAVLVKCGYYDPKKIPEYTQPPVRNLLSITEVREYQEKLQKEQEKVVRETVQSLLKDVFENFVYEQSVTSDTSDDRLISEEETKDDKSLATAHQEYLGGSDYYGEAKDKKMQGYGKMTSADGSVYEGEWKDGKKNGHGKMTFANDAVYEGEWKDGKKNGHGKMTFVGGSVYEGGWKDGIMHGHGKMTFANDAVYEGEWKDGDMHGYGKLILSDGTIYEGERKDGKNNGHGKMKYADGTIYEGEWKDDKSHGHGKLLFPDGMAYEGEWKDGNMHGHGKMKYADGSVYEGEWKGGKSHGHGKMTFANDAVYEGEWKDDYMHGHGKMTSADGRVYEGEWKDGRENGYGKVMDADGSIYEGEWKDGKGHGHGKMTSADGRVYEGEWKDGNMHGHGKMTFANDAVYEGEWKGGKSHGHGKMTSADGRVYEGEWKDGRENGYGKMMDADGSIYEGEWKDGRKNGHGKMMLASGSVYEGEWKDDEFEAIKKKNQKDLIYNNEPTEEESKPRYRSDSRHSRVKNKRKIILGVALTLVLICGAFAVLMNAQKVHLEGFRLSEEGGDGYGDSDGGDGVRESYTSEYIDSGALGDTVVFNAISDGNVGDERNFVGARPKGLLKSKKWSADTIKVKDGEIYTVCVYVHNDNPKSEDAVAENVKVAIAVPTNVWKTQTVVGYIDSDNASPSRCWDTVTFISDDLFYLEYLEETARYTNATMGTVEINNGTITLGALLGDDRLDGKIPGGYDHAGIVTMDVKVHKSVEASLQVDARLKGDGKWSESVDADIGDEVEFRICYENLLETAVDDVMIRDDLPSNMEYVERSTFLYNTENENGIPIEETITTDGVNIGSYEPKDDAIVIFVGRVIDKDLAEGNNQLVNWASATVRLTEVYKDDASVMVEK